MAVKNYEESIKRAVSDYESSLAAEDELMRLLDNDYLSKRKITKQIERELERQALVEALKTRIEKGREICR